MFRTSVGVLLALVSFQAGAATKRFKDQIVEGASHEVGAAKWHDDLSRTVSYGCTQSKPDDSVGCVHNAVRIHNESSLALQCHVLLEMPAPDDYGKSRYEADVVVFAGRVADADNVFRSFGPVALVPNRFTSDCIAIPAAIEPLEVPEECRGKVLTPGISDFYPPASVRRDEQGKVVLEYGVEEGSKTLLDVRVVSSSGFEGLDSAALRAAKFVRTFGQCPGRRYRITIAFTLGG